MTDMPERVWARRLTETDTRWQEKPYSKDDDHGMVPSLKDNIREAEYVCAIPSPLQERMAEALRELAREAMGYRVRVAEGRNKEDMMDGLDDAQVKARAVIAEYEQMKGE